MVASRSHDITANRLAKKYRTEYNREKGPDIKTPKIAIAVETPETVADAASHLNGHRGRVYVACTNKDAVNQALEHYKSTTIGVMDSQGKIIKRSTRK